MARRSHRENYLAGRDKNARSAMVIPAIEARTGEQRRHLRGMSDRGARRAVRRALNKALDKAFTQAKRVISEKRNIKVSRAAKDLKKIKAGSATTMQAEIRSRGKSIPAMDLKGRVTQLKGGVKMTVSKGNRQLFPGAFIATMPNGKVGVFESDRTAKHQKKQKGDRVYWTQLPIREIRFPTVASTLLQDDVQAKIVEVVNREFPIELDRAIRVEEKKLQRR